MWQEWFSQCKPHEKQKIEKDKERRALLRIGKHRHARRARVIFLGDRSIHGTVYSNDLVDLTSFFGCDVQQERNWEFMMYIRCYVGHGKIAK